VRARSLLDPDLPVNYGWIPAIYLAADRMRSRNQFVQLCWLPRIEASNDDYES